MSRTCHRPLHSMLQILPFNTALHIHIKKKNHAPSYLLGPSSWETLIRVIWNLSVNSHIALSVAVAVWNVLPASLPNLPTLSEFKAQLKKAFLFRQAFQQTKVNHFCQSACTSKNYKCITMCLISALFYWKICTVTVAELSTVIITINNITNVV